MRKINFVFILGLAISFSGCVMWSNNYKSIKPINPAPLGMFKSKMAESRSPTFKWEAADGVKRYDFAIWETIFIPGSGYHVGNKILFEKDIEGTEFRPNIELKPSTAYYWSVRPSGTNNWSMVDTWELVGNVSKQSTELFIFCTPRD